MTEPVEIWTDGACSGNPGPGGWGAILSYKGKERELSGGEALTTNNRMELMGAISALETLTRPCIVALHTDSQYLRQGITSWIHGWKKNGWKTADRKPVKNEELWKRLDAALKTAPPSARSATPRASKVPAPKSSKPWTPRSHSSMKSACPRSSGPPSPSAAPAAASPTTAMSSKTSSAAACARA